MAKPPLVLLTLFSHLKSEEQGGSEDHRTHVFVRVSIARIMISPVDNSRDGRPPRSRLEDGGQPHAFKKPLSVEPLSDRAIDGEAAASKFAAARTGNQAILHECQDLNSSRTCPRNPCVMAFWVHSNSCASQIGL